MRCVPLYKQVVTLHSKVLIGYYCTILLVQTSAYFVNCLNLNYLTLSIKINRHVLFEYRHKAESSVLSDNVRTAKCALV